MNQRLAGPLVSVVIPTRNRAPLLREALRSVRALEGDDLAIEIVIGDNGSTDGTFDLAREFGARVVCAKTRGAAAARNAAMRVATGEFIAFLDDDDVWLSGHLRPHVEMLRANPELAAVVGQFQLTDEHLSWRSEAYPAAHPRNGDLFASFLSMFQQIGATVVRSSVRDTVGYLDETIFGGEDWDWHLRIALRHKVGFVPEPCVLFRQRPPGIPDDLGWQRLTDFRRVFRMNVQRAGARRPPWPRVALMFLRLSGPFYNGFVGGALMHMERRERRLAARSLYRAVASSPAHAVRDLLHPSRLWEAIRWVAFPNSGPHAPARQR